MARLQYEINLVYFGRVWLTRVVRRLVAVSAVLDGLAETPGDVYGVQQARREVAERVVVAPSRTLTVIGGSSLVNL